MGSEERTTRTTSRTVMSSQASPEAVAASLAQTDSASTRHEEAEHEGTSSIHTPDQQNGSTATPDGTTQQQSIPKEQPRRRRHYWTKTHCWYAYIGGFVIQDLHGEAFPLPNGLARMSLNTEAILHFLANRMEFTAACLVSAKAMRCALVQFHSSFPVN
jgi:hypothetical protein